MWHYSLWGRNRWPGDVHSPFSPIHAKKINQSVPVQLSLESYICLQTCIYLPTSLDTIYLSSPSLLFVRAYLSDQSTQVRMYVLSILYYLSFPSLLSFRSCLSIYLCVYLSICVYIYRSDQPTFLPPRYPSSPSRVN
jgi:hypothetical protein